MTETNREEMLEYAKRIEELKIRFPEEFAKSYAEEQMEDAE